MTAAQVLVVDDSEHVRLAHERVLTTADYAVDCADSGAAALELLGHQSYDVILSDIAMPGMSGTELLRQVRRHDLDVPMILVTGHPSIDSAVEAVELGALSYLIKPVKPQAFLDAVEKAVRLHRLAQLRQDALELAGDQRMQVSDRAGLEATFSKGLAALWMAYQPIVRLSTREVFAYEALLRTDEPSIPHPGVFLDVAERLGRVHELGRAVRRAAAADAERLPEGVQLFVNLHPSDLMDDQLLGPDSPLCAHASRVVLEITERASLTGFRSLDERVRAIKEHGFRVAVDDLGAGYAGLSSLAHLDPQVAKIDMSLIRGIDQDPRRQTLVRSLTEACRELSMEVVAEGIETPEERDTLARLGCDLLQGFLFARPERPFVGVSFK
jgi:EAL domain-containing protein (putative c-di-GMP-specific phosphodiesterase class I)